MVAQPTKAYAVYSNHAPLLRHQTTLAGHHRKIRAQNLPKPTQMGEVLPKARREPMTVREKTCSKCGETKPRKDFIRKLTLAQSRALLKRPTLRTPHETSSKYCKACQPKEKLTIKKIQNKVSDGDIHEVIGDLLKIKLRKKISLSRSNAMKRVWQKQYDANVMPWYRNIQKQVAKKYNYYTLQRSRNNDPHLTAHAKLDYETAKNHKAHLFLQVKTGAGLKMDLLPRIGDYYTANEKLELYNLWSKIPLTIRNKLRGAR